MDYTLQKSQVKTFFQALKWNTSLLSAPTSPCCTWWVNSNWFWLYNACVIEMVISTRGLAALIGFHCVGCFTWQRATDTSHTHAGQHGYLTPLSSGFSSETCLTRTQWIRHRGHVHTHTRTAHPDGVTNKHSSKWYLILFITILSILVTVRIQMLRIYV